MPAQTVRALPRARRKSVLGAAVLLAAAVLAFGAWALLHGGEKGVSVYPDRHTLAASAATTISFRGVEPGELGEVVVVGSHSGRHGGRWEEHPDGRGATFVPDDAFAAGERVTVEVGVRVAGSDGQRSEFTIARAARIAPAPIDAAKPVSHSARVRSFRSRPKLRPPAVAVETASERAAPGVVFVAPKRGESQQGPMILDRAGELVWFRPLPGDQQAFDFRAQTYHGKPVITWWQGRVATYRGDGVGRIVDSSYRPVATVRAGNGYQLDLHEFTLTPAGTALIIGYVTVPWDLSKLGGRRRGLVEDNVVQEVDVETGAVLFEWHALGSIPLGDSYRPAPRERGRRHDPFHVNSVELEPNGNLLVSARHTSTLYEIDRRTGSVLWRVGGKHSSFAMGAGTRFQLQHDARRQPDGTITLFDNVAEDLPARGRESRAIRIALDQRRKRATLVREFDHPDGLLSPTQGSMQALRGGGAFVGWGGTQPVFSEFDGDGRLVFDARFRARHVESYRAYRMPWSARPAGRPAAVASTDGERTRVYASWNGATDVASWRVRTADGTVVAAPRTGFETAITVPGRRRRLTVAALDRAGRVLGTSPRIEVRSAG